MSSTAAPVRTSCPATPPMSSTTARIRTASPSASTASATTANRARTTCCSRTSWTSSAGPATTGSRATWEPTSCAAAAATTRSTAARAMTTSTATTATTRSAPAAARTCSAAARATTCCTATTSRSSPRSPRTASSGATATTACSPTTATPTNSAARTATTAPKRTCSTTCWRSRPFLSPPRKSRAHMNAERLESRRMLAFAPFTDEVVVPGSTPDSYDLAVAGDGSYIAAYADGTAVRAVRYSARGAQVGVTTAAAFATAVVNDVSVAMDADGDAVIAYTSFEPSANFGEFRYSHINRSGVVDRSGVLDIFDRGRAADVAVSMDPGGRFFISSIGYVAHAAYQLRFRSFDASGVQRGPAFTAFQQTLPESAVDNLDVGAFHDGSGAVFAYAFVDERGAVQRVNYGRVSTSALVGSIGKIEAAEVHLPSVAIHSDGSFAIAYEQWMIDDRGFPTLQWRDCRIRRFSAAGVQVGNVISTSGPFSGVNFLTPNLSATPDGGLVITYIERRYNDLQGNAHDPK